MSRSVPLSGHSVLSFSHLTGSFAYEGGLFTYSRRHNCKCKRNERLHFLKNGFICLKTKHFPTRNLNFVSLWENAFNAKFPLGWLSASKLLQMRQCCKVISSSGIYADARSCKNGKTSTCNCKLHPAVWENRLSVTCNLQLAHEMAAVVPRNITRKPEKSHLEGPQLLPA